MQQFTLLLAVKSHEVQHPGFGADVTGRPSLHLHRGTSVGTHCFAKPMIRDNHALPIARSTCYKATHEGYLSAVADCIPVTLGDPMYARNRRHSCFHAVLTVWASLRH